MSEKVAIVLGVVLGVVLGFGAVCLGVLLFALQFGFEWSFLLCVDVYIAIVVAKWIFSGNGKD